MSYIDNIIDYDLVNKISRVVIESRKEPIDLEISYPLDVHLWSDHILVKDLVDNLSKELGFTSRLWHKHLRIYLIDLFINWERGTYQAVHKSPNEYQFIPRYNSLRITSKIIRVVNTLKNNGYIIEYPGFYDSSKQYGRLTRVWPSPKLVERFSGLERKMISITDEQEVIILKDTKKIIIDYRETQKTTRWRGFVKKYNKFIGTLKIEHPTLETHDQFRLTRIFNNSSWSEGGRFYAPFQNWTKQQRAEITFNGEPTIELDYSGLHIGLLYAKEGLKPPSVAYPEGEHRPIYKTLLLTIFNASSRESAFRAFNQDRTDSGLPALPHKVLQTYLDQLLEIHSPLNEYVGSGIGTRLQNQDSQITELILKEFVKAKIPVLPIHDSYRLPQSQEQKLREVMVSAHKGVTGKEPIGIGYN